MLTLQLNAENSAAVITSASFQVVALCEEHRCSSLYVSMQQLYIMLHCQHLGL